MSFQEDVDFLEGINALDEQIGAVLNAMALRDADAGGKAWDALDAKIEDYQTRVASSPLTRAY